MQIKTDILSSSSLYNISASAYEILPSSSGTSYYELAKIVCTLTNVTTPYNTINNLDFVVGLNNTVFSLTSTDFNSSSSVINPLSTFYAFTESLSLRISGSGPTIGNGTLQLDTHYEVRDRTDTAPKITFGSDVEFVNATRFAHGFDTNAVGVYSHAEGDTTTAAGIGSHAEGSFTLAEGNYSHAEGNTTVAYGDYSHAGGEGTIASGSAQTAFGRYNTQNNVTDVFVIGGGANDLNRKDMFKVSTSSISLNAASSITGSLTVTGNVTATSFTGSLSGLTDSASFIRVSSSNITNSPFSLTFVPYSANMDDYRLLQTDNSLTYNPSTNILTVSNISGNSVTANSFLGTASWSSNALTSSFTPNALVTASVSSNVLTFTKGNGTTFNLTVNTGSGGGGTPGGADTNIQFNSGSAFSGSSKLTYGYDNAAQNSNRLYHQYSEDFRNNAFNVDFKGSYRPDNVAYSYKQSVGISHFQYKVEANTGAATICGFDADGGTPGNLSMQGFKCDYSLLLYDGVNKVASRVGTLLGAWSYDTGITPVIQDTFVDGDQVFNELGTVVFTLVWNGGSGIHLQMDCSNVNSGDTYFNGVFTNFGNTV